MRDEFLIIRQGKQFVLFAGLLDEGHNRGLRAIDTELLQVPSKENGNVAVVKATVELEDGRRFSGIGDASPESCSRSIADHKIRFAETRAKARALRDAINVAATAFEEISDTDDTTSQLHRQQPQTADNVSDINASASRSGRSENQTTDGHKKVRKKDVDLLKTLAVEKRGENGVERLENHLGKKIPELTRDEARSWIRRLTPASGSG